MLIGGAVITGQSRWRGLFHQAWTGITSGCILDRAMYRSALISTLLVSILVAQADAMSVMPPFRPVTEAEILLNSCELAEAIGVVRVERVYTDFYRDRNTNEDS